MPDTKAALVACSNSKRDNRNVSWALYNSTLFEKSWAAASLVGDPFVISAKHHLLTVDDRLDPYDKTLKNFSWDEKVTWAETVCEQLPEKYDEIVVFGGRDYVEPLLAVAEIPVRDVYEGTVGNGEQMATAGDIIENEL